MSLFSSLSALHRGLTTNHARLDPASDELLLRPLVSQRSAKALAYALQSWVSQQSNWQVESQEHDDNVNLVLHLTRTTRLVRFVDDLHVTLRSEGDTTTVTAESRSRVGKGDLGQNERNLRELMQVLRDSGD